MIPLIIIWSGLLICLYIACKRSSRKKLEKPKAKNTFSLYQHNGYNKEFKKEENKIIIVSTGCELTDQIFEAAWKAGINPIDIVGPAPNYDDDI
jgi:hypothetical protein